MMKLKITLLLIALQGAMLLSAQEYPVQWSYCYDSFIFEPPGFEGPFPTEIQNNGVINIFGKNCAMVDGPFLDYTNVGIIYNEGEKTYWYSSEDGEFHILYDFSLEAGDTLKLPAGFMYNGSNQDTLSYEITKVDSFLWNGNYLKVQHISPTNFFGLLWGLRNIEKMGNDAYFIPIESGSEIDPTLVRVDFEVAYYINSVCYLTDTKDLLNPALEPLISPNPFSDNISIDATLLLSSTDQQYQLEITTIAGQILFTDSLERHLELSSANWPKGLYLLNIKEETGPYLFAKKLVKY